MFIRVFYTIHDGGDGSASVSFHTSLARGDAAMKRDVDSHHLNDGEGCNTLDIDTNDFPEIESISWRRYKIASDKLNFQDWIDEDSDERWNAVEDWQAIWDSLEAKGIYPPDVLDSTISLIRSEYGE